MIIIIPINTDAPIYHWPWMTLVLIAANCGIFFLTGHGADEEGCEGWLLRFGHGLHPIEWLANNFLHFGWLHLIGNMIFLWGYGIVVEGKLGWWRYLLVYLLIGALGGLSVQTAMLGYDGPSSGSGGASVCIYGLLAICVVWAPKNEMDCFVLLGYRALMVEVTILTFGAWFIALEVLGAWWNGFGISSAMLHLVGAFWGFGVGVVMLKWKLVDCENWDLFAVWNGTYGQISEVGRWQDGIVVNHSSSPDAGETTRGNTVKKKKQVFRPSIYQSDESRRRKADVPGDPSARRSNPATQAGDPVDDATDARKRADVQRLATLPAGTRKALERMRELLKEGKAQAALNEYQKRLRIVEHWPLDAGDLQALADGLFKLKAWAEAIPLLEEYAQRFPGRDAAARIKLAAVFCEVQKRPRAALKQLEDVELDELSAAVQKHVVQIRQKAERLIEDGILELDGRGW